MTAPYGAVMANVNSKTGARKRVREAQARADEAHAERERNNVDDAAAFLVELGRLAAVDEWEQGSIGELRAEGAGGMSIASKVRLRCHACWSGARRWLRSRSLRA